MVNGTMSIVEMEMDLKKDEEVISNELTVEQMLPLVGGCGMFQKLLVAVFTRKTCKLFVFILFLIIGKCCPTRVSFRVDGSRGVANL